MRHYRVLRDRVFPKRRENCVQNLTVSQMSYIVIEGLNKRRMHIAHSSVLHVRVDNELKTEAAGKLAQFGLIVSDAAKALVE